MSDEGDSFGGRLGRYARVGTSVGGLAVKLAGQRYLGFGLDRDKHAGELKAALGGLKGPLMKAAQLLATIPMRCRRNMPASWRNCRPTRRPWVGLRAPPHGVGTRARLAGQVRALRQGGVVRCSLGQVHRATLLDGREVAAKLQYPDMSSALEADLNSSSSCFAIGQRFDPAIRTDEIHAEITNRLREELDYRREAKHAALYRHMLRDEAQVHVPGVVASHSTERLLTMEWLNGAPLLDWKTRSQEERDALAIAMFRAWYVPFYFYGAIHGDPHLGNYSVRPDGSVNLMDFGCIRIFPPRFVRGSIELYRAPDDRRRGARPSRLRGLGLYGTQQGDDRDPEPLGRVPLRAADGRSPAPPHEGMADGYGREMAQNVFGELRKMGGVRPPREFVFMDRAAIGLGSVFIHLRASINWHQLFEGLIDGFDVDALTQRQAWR